MSYSPKDAAATRSPSTWTVQSIGTRGTSTTFPEHRADEGTHEFTYSWLPFPGQPAFGDVTRHATLLNTQPLALDGADASALRPLFHLRNADGISLEAVKRAEDSDDLIIRLAEIHGSQVTPTLDLGGIMPAATTPLETTATALSSAPAIPLAPFQFTSLRT